MDAPRRDPSWRLRMRGDRVELRDEHSPPKFVAPRTERNRRKRDRKRRGQ